MCLPMQRAESVRDMKRVLFVAYFYPPLANSGTQRPFGFANCLPDFGWEPLVLTVADPPDHQLDNRMLEKVRPGTRIFRVPMLSDAAGSLLARPLGAVANAPDIASAISWRVRRHFRFPDLYALWRPTAVRAGLKIFREIGFDAVWATGFPWTSLVIGRDISRKTGVPLIADFRDLWTGEDLIEPIPEAELPRHKRLERSVLAQAAAVTSPSAVMNEELKALAPPDSRRHFVTMTNGFDRTPGESAVSQNPIGKRARVRIVYAGVWKPGYGLDALYEAIRALSARGDITPVDVEVVAAGFTPGHAERFGIAEYVSELGRVSHDEASWLMRSADILFLPAAAGKRRDICVPGKLFEYAAASRRIIALAENPSAVRTFLNEVGGAIVLEPEKSAELTDVIAALATGSTVHFAPVNPLRLHAYDRSTIAQRLACLLDELTGAEDADHFRCSPAASDVYLYTPPRPAVTKLKSEAKF
jgi:hypothetical protein